MNRMNNFPFHPRSDAEQDLVGDGPAPFCQVFGRDLFVAVPSDQDHFVACLYIRDIRHGYRMDFQLKPKDIVFVPRDGISEWNVVVRQLLPTIQLLNGLAGPFGSPSSFIYR